VTELVQIQEALSLFAEAIADRPVEFVRCDAADSCWPWSSPSPQVGEVNLPAEIASRLSFRSVVLHQLHRSPLPAPASSDLAAELFSLLEDLRSLAVLERQFPGAMPHLQLLLATIDDVRCTAPESPSGVAWACLRLSGLGWTSGDIISRLPDSQRPLGRFVLAEADVVRKGHATATTSLRAAESIARLVAAPARHFDRAANETLSPEQLLESDGGASLGADDASTYETSAGTGGGQLLNDMDSATQVAGDPSEPARVAGLHLEVSATRSDATRRSFVYDEWDYHEQRLRRAWCTVHEELMIGDDFNFIGEVRRRHHALRSGVRRTMRQLRPQQLVRVHRSLDGEELDLDAAIEAVIDRRSGAPVDDRVTIRRDRAERSVATAFLVDLSASTSSLANPPEPEPFVDDPESDPMSYGPIWETPPTQEQGRRVLDVAKDAVALMGDALSDLGDAFAIYGFSGTGRDGVEFVVAKDFDDPAGSAAWAGVAAMKPLRYTRMGPAIRHATTKLQRQPAVTKQLIVLSDGYPQDTDYGRDRHDRDYGIYDTAHALRTAGDAGVRTFCVTIDPAGHDYLRSMCSPNTYLVIDDVEALPAQLAEIYLTNFLRN